MSCEPISITQTSGESYGLAELLRAWQIAPEFSQGISERWQCEIVPTATSEEEIRQHVLDGTPVLVPSEYGRRACEQVGDDALHYLTGCPERNTFPRPKIAFVAGWGRPGSQLADDEELQLVDSFQSVLEQSESGKPLNLQMFHRDDEGAPRIPQLPAALEWPLPDLFGMENGEAPRTTPTCNTSTENSRSCAGECQGGRGALLRYPCDMATRVSARGALTWWHLDDGGEFVIQVGMPLGGKRLKQDGPSLIGPSGKPVVKLFIFAPRHAYEFICQDAETNKTRRFAHLDLFNTPSHWLPEAAADMDPLPTFWVAPLEAGTRPLLSPPNVPHLVITLEHCVMVEQRIIATLFLDEVYYFMAKAARDWVDEPKYYPFITETLQDPEKIDKEVVETLKSVVLSHADLRVRARARESLRSILAAAGSFFKVGQATVSEIQELLKKPEVASLASDKRTLEQEKLLGLLKAKRLPAGVSQLPGGKWGAYVHVGGRPMWGRVRASLEEAVADRKDLVAIKKRGLADLEDFLLQIHPPS